MIETQLVKRSITFGHRKPNAQVDVVPIGFSLFSPSTEIVERFYGFSDMEPELVLLCFCDTFFLEGDEETPVPEIAPFLQEREGRIHSPMVDWYVPEDAHEETIEFELSVLSDLPKIQDRLEWLESCLLRTLNGRLPCWFQALKDDYQRRVPAYYLFTYTYGIGAILTTLKDF